MHRETSEDESGGLNSAKKSISETFRDKILLILLKSSNMTRKQFESFLIDAISNDFFNGSNLSRMRPQLRTDRNLLSRGSFDRTLAQARKNVVEAIYTVLLLGYTGLLETPQLEPFIEVGNRLKTYSELRREQQATEETGQVEGVLMNELTDTLTRFLIKRSRAERR